MDPSKALGKWLAKGDVVKFPEKSKTHIGAGKPESPRHDPFHFEDTKTGKTKAVLQQHSKPVHIHTSSDLVAHDDYIKHIPKGSTVNLHSQQAKGHVGPQTLSTHIKPGFPSDKRLKNAGKKLESAGHKVVYHNFKESEKTSKTPWVKADENALDDLKIWVNKACSGMPKKKKKLVKDDPGPWAQRAAQQAAMDGKTATPTPSISGQGISSGTVNPSAAGSIMSSGGFKH